MIVPRDKLLFWTALITVPSAAMLGLHQDFTLLPVTVMAVFLVLVLRDALLALGQLQDVTVRVPEVLRLSKDRQGELELFIQHKKNSSREFRLGLRFPRTFSCEQEEITFALAGHEEARLTWLCTPSSRGVYIIEACYLEEKSPLQFWAVRSSKALKLELRVYPNLLAERKSTSVLFLHRGLLGVHAQRQLGQGREFEKLRNYVAGDNYEDIHWKATAKRGYPVTKEFQIERTQQVYVIIDASRLSNLRPHANCNGSQYSDQQECNNTDALLERFINAALLLGMAAERQGDLYGLITFSDTIHTFVRAQKGQAHFRSCRDALYTLFPKLVTPDFDELFSFIRLRLRRRALLVFLTHLDDPMLAEHFTRNVELISRQHVVLVNMIRPPGVKPLFRNSEVESPADIYQELAGHLHWQDLRHLGQVMQQHGAGFSTLADENLSLQLITQYMNVKQRQLL